MEERILFVDDEEFVLAAFRRHLRNKFSIETALNGMDGLEVLTNSGPIAVVVADLQMPGMDGVQFLSEVKKRSPDTVRIMLTGHADLQKAIEAVNEGNIFRFLTKPSTPEVLMKAVQSGLQQYRLVTAEKVLLENTLKHSVRLMTEVLSMANPAAFSRTLRLRQIVHTIVMNMNLENAWEVELAALLSQIGCIVLPKMIMEKVNDGKALTQSEQSLYGSYAHIGYRWLENIPRLEYVAQIVRDQQKVFSDYPISFSLHGSPKNELGAQILKVALDYEVLLRNGAAPIEAINRMVTLEGKYNPKILDILRDQKIVAGDWSSNVVELESLEPGMTLGQDVYSKDGEILAHKSQLITEPLCEWLGLVAQTRGVIEPIRVFNYPDLAPVPS